MNQQRAVFQMDPDRIDPAQVPKATLHTGAVIPVVGLGTFGSDAVSGETIAEAVLGAARVGYRHFDCASVYGNEHLIGHSFQKMFQKGLRREEFWVTSKLWNDKHGENDVIPSCEKSLKDIGLDYLDLYLITGRSRISIHLAVTSPHAARKPSLTFTKTKCGPGGNSRRWSGWDWSGTSERRT